MRISPLKLLGSLAVALISVLSNPSPATGQAVDFESGRWSITAGKVQEHVGRKAFQGTAFLNDVQFADGTIEVDVAVTSNRSAIYRIAGGGAEVWLSGPEIGRPNGIAVDGKSLIVGTNLDGCLKSIDLATKAVGVIARLGAGIIDGIAVMPGGRYIVSHNEGRLFLVKASPPGEGTAAKVMDMTVPARNIAGFAYIESGEKSVIVFPTFTDNRLAAYNAPASFFARSFRRPSGNGP